jgi:hypothetical protein
MTASIDLSQRAFAYQRHEITGVGTWLLIDGDYHPCLALLRRGEEMSGATRPYIITLDKAWIWDERIGDGAQTARQLLNICESLRLEPDERNIFRIYGFINDHLGDLISMPPFPPNVREAGTVIGEVTVTDRATGKTLIEDVLTDV